MACHPAPLAPPGKPSHSQTTARGDPLTWGWEGKARALSSVALSVKMLSKLAAEAAVSLSDLPPGESTSQHQRSYPMVIQETAPQSVLNQIH